MNDLHFAFRQLRRNPGFSTVAVLTLALGIGASAAVFTISNALLWRTLAEVRDPHRLVLVTEGGESSLVFLAYPTYEQLRDEGRSVLDLCATAQIGDLPLRVAGSGDLTESVPAQAVSADFFEVLGVRAALGRTLIPSRDALPDSPPVAVISYGLWQRRFGSDPTAVGRTVFLDDVAFIIVGVAPRGFSGFEVGRHPDLWWPIHLVPLVEGKKDALASRANTWVRLVGRLKPGVPWQQAAAELRVRHREILDEQSARWGLSEEQRVRHYRTGITLQPGWTGSTELGQGFRQPLAILMAMVGLLLLIACANLAGLLLARGLTRHHELSLRLALGASRWTVVRQLLTESLVLAAASGVLGLLLAQGGATLLAGYLPGFGQTLRLALSPDLHVLAFTFLVSALTGVLFGLVPAWRGSCVALATSLKSRTAPWASVRSGQRWNKAFVVSQIALSGCLLIGAGLFVRTVQHLKSQACGFNRERLLVFELRLGKDYGRTPRASLCRQLLQRLESLPGVRCASLSSTRSLTGADGGWGSWRVSPAGARSDAGEGVQITSVCVTPRYLETLGIPLRRGREFLPRDESPAAGATGLVPPVAIVDETLARRLFGDADPVGEHLRSRHRDMPVLAIVGVAGNTKHSELRSRPDPTLYLLEMNYLPGFHFFYVRTLADPSGVVAGIRHVVRDIEPTAEVAGLRTMDDVVNEYLFQERTLSELASLFSVSALILACLGLYGTLSYGVARRTQEIGVRMALGARIGDVLSLVIREGMGLAAGGCALGLALALAMTRLVASHLYGITPLDPLTFMVVGLALLAAAFLACYLPARRAARVDPMVALRCE